MIPTCPKCGCPPRFRTTTRVVKTELRSDGDQLVEGKAKHIGRVLPDSDIKYECGGGHRWNATLETS